MLMRTCHTFLNRSIIIIMDCYNESFTVCVYARKRERERGCEDLFVLILAIPLLLRYQKKFDPL